MGKRKHAPRRKKGTEEKTVKPEATPEPVKEEKQKAEPVRQLPADYKEKNSIGLRCPLCKREKSVVTQTRRGKNGTIRRRRRCLFCGRWFTTYESFSY